MPKKVHNPHDKLLFLSLQNKDVARDAMRAHLPQALLEVANLDKIKLYNTKFVTPEFKYFEADVLYEVPLKNGKGLFMMHCEHQSSIDANMPLRVWQYLFGVLADFRQNHPKEPLPVIWPIILYTGYREYSASTDFFEMFDENKELAQQFMLNEFKLVDVRRLPDSDIRKHKLFGLTEFAFKHKWTQDFKRVIDEQMQWMSVEVSDHKYKNYARMLATYIISEYKKGSVELIIEAAEQYLDETLSEDVMTIADQLIAKGKQEGMQKGMQEGMQKGEKAAARKIARSLIKQGLPLELIAESTGLSLSELQSLKTSK